MARNELASGDTLAQRKPRWRTPKLTLDNVTNATGSDLNQPGDDGLTVYPGIDLGNFS
ncbi:MAG: hypothetical protein V4574_01945 [Pseudomonadota bacterium]